MISPLWVLALASAHAAVLPTTSVNPPSAPTSFTIPKPAYPDNATYVGLITCPGCIFDGPASARVDDAVIWVTGDTMVDGGFATNSLFWSNITACGDPITHTSTGDEIVLFHNNDTTYYRPSQKLCSGAKGSTTYCGPGARYTLWPGTNPLPIDNGTTTKIYYLMNNWHSYDGALMADSGKFPTKSLYRSDHIKGSGTRTLPPVTLISDSFWGKDVPAYGHDGWVKGDDDGLLYLYGRGNQTMMFLARVAPEDFEDKSRYEFWWNGPDGTLEGGRWTTRPHSIFDVEAAGLPNAGPESGTFYFSKRFNGYIWLGNSNSGKIRMSMSSRPEGPWLQTWVLAYVQPGERLTYSFVAHPDISEDRGNGGDIYFSYSTKGGPKDENRLYHVKWQ